MRNGRASTKLRVVPAQAGIHDLIRSGRAATDLRVIPVQAGIRDLTRSSRASTERGVIPAQAGIHDPARTWVSAEAATTQRSITSSPPSPSAPSS